jgi:hypothetical protein
MDMPQVSFNQQIAQTDAAEPEGMRIFSLTGSAKIIRKGLSRDLSAWAQELNLDADPLQRAVCRDQVVGLSTSATMAASFIISRHGDYVDCHHWADLEPMTLRVADAGKRKPHLGALPPRRYPMRMIQNPKLGQMGLQA